MKVRFVTTLDHEIIKELKIMAAEQGKPVNAIIEKLVKDKRSK